MPDLLLTVTRIAEAVALLVGLVIIFLALKGYRKSNVTSLLLLALGFSLIVLGSLVEGLLFEVFAYPLPFTHAVRALISSMGFIVILYSYSGLANLGPIVMVVQRESWIAKAINSKPGFHAWKLGSLDINEQGSGLRRAARPR